ncbi:hypothetical protein DXG01_015019 [Tephrocybe rancida]|nr:hypothetical protein DXG01_015019 [Tephrocybe rancida]
MLREWRVEPTFGVKEAPEVWRKKVLSQPVLGLTLGVKGCANQADTASGPEIAINHAPNRPSSVMLQSLSIDIQLSADAKADQLAKRRSVESYITPALTYDEPDYTLVIREDQP